MKTYILRDRKTVESQILCPTQVAAKERTVRKEGRPFFRRPECAHDWCGQIIHQHLAMFVRRQIAFMRDERRDRL